MAFVLSGCPSEPSSTREEGPPVEARTADTAPKVETAPSDVKIGTPKLAWRDESVLTFEIPYEFVSGSPHKVYRWMISFPGTGELGSRDTEAWELKEDGIQKTALQLGSNTMEKYSIELFESKSPDTVYYSISNTVTGDVPRYSAPEPPSTPADR